MSEHDKDMNEPNNNTETAAGDESVSKPAAEGLRAGRPEDAAERDEAREAAIAEAELIAARLAQESGEGLKKPETGVSDDDAEKSASAVELESQVSDLTDRLLRAHAEIQNLHKRLERDIVESQKYGITKFARDIVAMTDNFDRAQAAVSPEARDGNPAVTSLLDGVKMIEKEFQNVLGRHGVKRLDPTNAPFDPHKHQAVMEREDASVPAGTVLQVFQPGYEIDGRILRPAMVVVARGGPKPVKPVAEAGDQADEDAAEDPSADNADKTNGDAAA